MRSGCVLHSCIALSCESVQKSLCTCMISCLSALHSSSTSDACDSVLLPSIMPGFFALANMFFPGLARVLLPALPVAVRSIM